MLYIENLKYNLEINRANVSVYINYIHERGDFLYACYLLKDSEIIERRNYQASGYFDFTNLENGLYQFSIFVKEVSEMDSINDRIWKYTETFKIEHYNIGVIANNDVISIIKSINSLSIVSSNNDLCFNKEVEYIFLDISYIAAHFARNHNTDICEAILEMIKTFSANCNELILLEGYFENQKEINEVSLFVTANCDYENINIINPSQILKWSNKKIVYENYDRYKSVIIKGVNDVIENHKKKDIENSSIEISLNKNTLTAEIKNKKAINAQYTFYVLKDGDVYRKNSGWSNCNKLVFELNECGIYCVQGFIKYNGFTHSSKSYTVEYFTEEYRKQFEEFLDNNEYNDTDEPLELFQLEAPFADFAIIQSKIALPNKMSFSALESSKNPNNQLLTFYEEERAGEYNRYIISGKVPYEREGKKIIFSGLINNDSLIETGDNCASLFLNAHPKLTGIYSVATIDNETIYLANDFFNFNRLFYYFDDTYIICSNRYHLILLVLNKLNIKPLLNESKALLSLSSVNIQFLAQNSLSEMDIKGVFKCNNAYDILLDPEGIHFIKNEYGKIINSKENIDEHEYREMLYKGRNEIVNNINTILQSEKYKNIIADLTGGLDSRIVYGSILQNDKHLDKVSIHSHDVINSNDLDIAIKINNLYNLKWDVSGVVKRNLTPEYSDKMQRSFYLGTYYSHNPIIISSSAKNTIKLIGACGEILLRPYISRKYFNTQLKYITDANKFLSYVLKDFSPGIITDYKASVNFINLHIQEFKNYPFCSNLERLDRIYLEHRHGYHFDQGLMNSHGILSMMPLQSKTLFALHHKIYNRYNNIKLQLDMTNILDPYLSAFEYDDDKDNRDKKFLKDLLLYEKEWHRNISFDTLACDRSRYESSIIEKKKNQKYTNFSNNSINVIDYRYKTLAGLKYLCNNNSTIRNYVGIALWHYISNHKNDKKLRFLYNKIESLKDQMKLFSINM